LTQRHGYVHRKKYGIGVRRKRLPDESPDMSRLIDAAVDEAINKAFADGVAVGKQEAAEAVAKSVPKRVKRIETRRDKDGNLSADVWEI
jgi:hypothetical protein